MGDKLPVSFEEKLARIDAIVKELEAGTVDLGRATELFKEGKTLARDCEQLLKVAQEQIDKAVSGNENALERPSLRENSGVVFCVRSCSRMFPGRRSSGVDDDSSGRDVPVFALGRRSRARLQHDRDSEGTGNAHDLGERIGRGNRRFDGSRFRLAGARSVFIPCDQLERARGRYDRRHDGDDRAGRNLTEDLCRNREAVRHL